MLPCGAYVEVRGQLVGSGTGSLLLPCRFWDKTLVISLGESTFTYELTLLILLFLLTFNNEYN